MTWRLQVRHHTHNRYAAPVVSSYNEARISPLSTHRQMVIDAQVEVAPPTSLYRYWDYWGTLVHAFDVLEPHTEMSLTASSVVETSLPPELERQLGWDEMGQPDVADRLGDLLVTTRLVTVGDETRAVAASLVGLDSPADACRAASEWVRSRLRYESGTTTVSSDATHALAQGAGVCQDFAHLTLALLRTAGVPCRYVSGYLHPQPDAAVGDVVVGESHAWIEAWVGDWLALDPTSGADVGERHVVVGRARDYADVTPLKGVFHGGPAEGLDVAVELTRLA
ncbi:MAG TPA: transglutaminase family protein [Acidimicrobiales bacterium]|nr:transglutaminase family protein [Acidimicrobiales bacterium]